MKKLLGIISLVVCVTMLLCGCGGMINVKSLAFNSIQSDSEVTVKISGKTERSSPNPSMGMADCEVSGKSEKDVIKEFEEKNDVTLFTVQDFSFVKIDGIKGVYRIFTAVKDDVTIFSINDMSCSIESDGELWVERFPFPYFMLGTSLYLQTDYVFNCDGLNLLSLVKTLGIWEVEEKENSFIMSFKENKVEVVYGDGTVTLQPVAK